MLEVRNQEATLSTFLSLTWRKTVYISEVGSANVPDCKHVNFLCQTFVPL